MNKKINKVLKEAQIYVQELQGWPDNWIVYLRYNHDKFTMKAYSKTKPKMTKKRKEKLITTYLEDREVGRHNRPILIKVHELAKDAYFTFDCFSNVVGRNEQVFEIIKKALLDNCEYPKVNEALQRLLDYETTAKEWRHQRSLLKDSPDRVLLGEEPNE